MHSASVTFWLLGPSVVLGVVILGGSPIQVQQAELSRVVTCSHPHLLNCDFPPEITFSAPLNPRSWREPNRKRVKVIAAGNSRVDWELDWRGHHHNPMERFQRVRKKVTPKSSPKREKVDNEECNGYKNFIHDLEVLSLELTVLGYIKASIAWFLHLANQAYGFFSVYFIGGKERVTFITNLLFPDTIPDQIERWFGILGTIDYLIIRYLSYPVGNLIFVIDSMGQILGLISLLMDVFTTFDDVFEPIIQSVTGIDLKVALSDYACANPVDQQQGNK